ncbi:restriction endonuclease subunit S [Nosocomiicoccus ampullae]|uniref:restriction endonuclease subunit S n=1 Tax=Nosocomiicoccus ampullae TaxID=489910 RepID=UPI00254B2EE0|nr:restriction endonuclease subunit S [Nosocomiicoccus ampullae]MDK6862872.1 restriction endonuclease subunit S [Nosocomiicoccus ampullae]
MNLTNITELCDIQIGRTPKRSEVKYWGNGHSWLSIADMGEKYVYDSKEEVTNLAVEECRMKVVPKNTVVMSFKLTIGRLGITEKDLYTNEAIAAFLIKDKNLLLPEYLYYSLKGYNFDHLIDRAAKGKTLNKRKLSEIYIPLIPIDNQKKIIEILNKAENLLVKRQQQIEALSALKQSVFLDMFGDPNSTDCKFVKKRIGEVFEVQTGKTPSRKRIDYWDKEEVPWIKTTEVQNVEINVNEEFITNLAMTESKLKLFSENTILIAMYGQGKTRGQSGILKFPATCNQACAALLPNEEMEMQFVWNQLLIQYDSLRALGRGGNQPNLNLSLVRGFEIIVPPNELQKKYADKLKKIDEFIQKIENSLGQLTTLYNSLLQKAFNGELLKEEIKA